MTDDEINRLWDKACECTPPGEFIGLRFARLLLNAERVACAYVCYELDDSDSTHVAKTSGEVHAWNVGTSDCARAIMRRVEE